MKLSVPTQESTADSSHSQMSALSARAIACLQPLADRYVWWKPSEEAMLYPNRVVAQIMNLGTFDDVTELVDVAGEDYLREILKYAEAGQFNERSWHYWHYRLGLADYGKIPVPPMPTRKIA